MNKIKVYLQYPWKFPDSPYYKSLVQNPPKGIEYLNAERQKGVIIKKKFFWISNFLKRNIRRSFNFLRISVPNAHQVPAGDYNLVHCAHCLPKSAIKPWIADFEDDWQMYVGEKTKSAQRKVLNILKEDKCKRILAWTDQAKENLQRDFPEAKDKIEVLYPAIPEKKFREKRSENINLIFSGRYFYAKGGLHALEAIDRLTKKYSNVFGIINSEVPEEIQKKYSPNEKIKFYGLMPQSELFKLYEKSDIMIYPGYSDSFGFGFLEAMSFGIPVITVDGFARKEIIGDGRTGFVVERPEKLDIRSIDKRIVDVLVDKASKIIEDKKLREMMSKNCINAIKEGKFSIKERNEKLKDIYEKATMLKVK